MVHDRWCRNVEEVYLARDMPVQSDSTCARFIYTLNEGTGSGRGMPRRRKYSRVMMARIRCATAGSQVISSERHRSMAARRSLRNATHAGQLSMCALICSQVRGSTLASKYSDRLVKSSRHSLDRCGFFDGIARTEDCDSLEPPGCLLASVKAWVICLRTARRARCKRTRTVPACRPRICAI